MVQTRSARRASMGEASSSNVCSTSLKSTAGMSTASELQKLWEGDLLYGRQPNLNFVGKLEGYMDPAISNLVSAWPPSLTVVASLGAYSDKASEMLCIGRSHFVVFRPKENHAAFQSICARQSCGIIVLPTQVIVLYASDEDCCQVNGLLFHAESSVVAKFSKEVLSVLYPENWLQLLTGSSDGIVSATASESDTTAQGTRPATDTFLRFAVLTASLDGTVSATASESDTNPPGARPVTRSSRRYKAPAGKMPIVRQSPVKYAPFWKGTLFGGPDREKPVRICTVAGYSLHLSLNDAISLAADWPDELHVSGAIRTLDWSEIERLKMYFLIFTCEGSDDFFQDLRCRENSLIVKLPSQALYLKANRKGLLTAALFPADVVTWVRELGAGKRKAPQLPQHQ